MIFGTIFEMLGAITVGARTADTIKNGIIPNSAFKGDAGVQMLAFTCALRSGGGVSCWGKNDKDQLGPGTSDGSSALPVAVTGLGAASDLAVGDQHACAVVEGAVLCWGRNNKGQLGTPGGDRAEPMPVPGLE